MDDEDVRALEALQVPGNLSEHVRLRGMATCPHCYQGFGHASLPIHVRRCRSLLPPTEEEEAAAEQDKANQSIRRNRVRSLVDLCLRFVTKHFESVCMDRIVAFPEAEAALIASMPSNLLHRMVVNLVQDSKRAKMKNRESRAMIEMLESALQGARRDVAQLESARDWAAISRARMEEQRHVSDRLQRELDTTKTALSSAELENQKLRAKVESSEKKLLRLEAKINSLKAEKREFKIEAHRRQMELSNQLLSAHNSRVAASSEKARLSRSFKERRRSEEDTRRSKRSPTDGSSNSTTSNTSTQQRHSLTYHERPHAEGSKIPYPKS
ncbi:hypothetical protein, variant 1 [Phytophthora nicotianae INRA-310]|uniref:Uncharacterized protein n=3 Tax=Phytophthora nicotianae TaxID=4792 RepID=W2QWJ8_PHYN3|nr:hypothetical protein, variant 1 [Phytophthora nicotianae INRA-310]ETN16824.1 hypothetical protein, variant 1 [Phytophthora nicotianae INRA-310]